MPSLSFPTMSSSYYMCVPSHTQKGPLRAKDVELARMPCFIGSDYHYFHNVNASSTTTGTTTTTCSICTEDTINPETIFRQLPCKHAFHKPCIDKWICKKDASCPLCRRTFYNLRRPFLVPGFGFGSGSGAGAGSGTRVTDVGDIIVRNGNGNEEDKENERLASWEEFTLWWKKFFGLV